MDSKNSLAPISSAVQYSLDRSPSSRFVDPLRFLRAQPLSAELLAYQAGRERRYQLLRVARHATPAGFRTRQCSSSPAKDRGFARDYVEAALGESGRAHWSGVYHCGSVWTCPVCSARIAEHRRKEVLEGLAVWRSFGGVCVLLTLTFSHALFDALSEQLSALSRALSSLKGSRRFRAIMQRLGYVGAIRALETRHGAHGWHSHTHEVLFLAERPTAEQLEAVRVELSELWARTAERCGLGRPDLVHGVHFSVRDPGEDSDEIGAYLTKFASEVSSPQQKLSFSAAVSSRSPWQILGSIQPGTPSFDVGSLNLWREYAVAFRGRRALYWSPGLRDLLGLDRERSDSELADEVPESVVRSVPLDSARYVVLVRAGAEAAALQVLETSGETEFLRYVEAVFERANVLDLAYERQRIEARRQIDASTERACLRLGLGLDRGSFG